MTTTAGHSVERRPLDEESAGDEAESMFPGTQELASRLSAFAPDTEALASRVSAFEEEARTLIRQQPVAAVLAALGVGYLVARLSARGGR